MHEKYAKDGLACLSVSLDDPKEKGKLENTKEFLQARKAFFTNVVLDEDQDFWTAKLRISGPPCIYVFNREGKWMRFYNPPGSPDPKEGEHYREVEKLVTEWLKK